MATVVNASLLAARMAMIESQLKPCGVVSPRISAAFLQVAREQYVAAGRRGLAYVDAAQPLGNGRALLAPLSLGLLLEEAAAQPHEHVLVVGAATGYSAALLASLASSVVALECDPALAETARANLRDSTNVSVVEGPLDRGWADGAPYDVMLIDGAVEQQPAELASQLAEGGRMLAILIGADGVSRAARGIRRGASLSLEPFAEAPGQLLPSFGKARQFRF